MALGDTATPLYKILIDGKSCQGDSLEWSLPRDGQPGEWQEHVGELRLCSAGLHVTDDPAQWWQPHCTVYLAEAEGVVGRCADAANRKAVARRVRLMREAPRDELAALHIYLEGIVRAPTSGMVIASGSATVEAYGSATVEAYGSATVRAYGSATVRAYDSATVEASDSATVEASGSATVEAYDSATVEASGSATVVSRWGSPVVRLIERQRGVHLDRRSGALHIYSADGEWSPPIPREEGDAGR